MTADHSSYEELAAQRRRSDEYREGYAEARRAFLIGQAVRVAAAAAGFWRLGSLCLLGWSFAWTLVAISAVSYRQQVAPEHLTGRVSTPGWMLALGVGWTGGALTSGLPGQLVGARTAMITLTPSARPTQRWRGCRRCAPRSGRTATHPEFSVDSALAGSD